MYKGRIEISSKEFTAVSVGASGGSGVPGNHGAALDASRHSGTIIAHNTF